MLMMQCLLCLGKPCLSACFLPLDSFRRIWQRCPAAIIVPVREPKYMHVLCEGDIVRMSLASMVKTWG